MFFDTDICLFYNHLLIRIFFIHQVTLACLLEISRLYLGFFHSSVGKEFTCNAGDPGLIPGSGRSTAEGIGYSLQYSWALLVAQLVKNPHAMLGTWVRSLGWEGKGYLLQYSGLDSMDCSPWGLKESDTTEGFFTHHLDCICFRSISELSFVLLIYISVLFSPFLFIYLFLLVGG